jgi:hypothetical protein
MLCCFVLLPPYAPAAVPISSHSKVERLEVDEGTSRELKELVATAEQAVEAAKASKIQSADAEGDTETAPAKAGSDEETETAAETAAETSG